MQIKDLRNTQLTLQFKHLVIIVIILLCSNFLTYWVISSIFGKSPPEKESLYLINQAKKYVYDVHAFEEKVREVSDKLAIPPEWLMAVMHSESRFDASVKNHKGSGATGLIQFMPATAKDINITVDKLRNMNHIEQLDFVYTYLNGKRKYHKKDFKSLTDLYLAILYPKAMNEDNCYTLYAKPSKSYKMNVGLDNNKDGQVTVQDIDKRMKRVYPQAYIVDKDETKGIYKTFIGSFGFD